MSLSAFFPALNLVVQKLNSFPVYTRKTIHIHSLFTIALLITNNEITREINILY
jgi:hypothetical protein